MKQAVCLLITDARGDRYLGVGRPVARHLYGLIGGKVEPGETLETAALREALEETGLRIPRHAIRLAFVATDDRFIVATYHVAPLAQEALDALPAVNAEGYPLRWLSKQEMCDPAISRFADYNTALFLALEAHPSEKS